jgi:hypothetical protein
MTEPGGPVPRPRAPSLLHINQHVIRANRKTGARDPVITVKRARTNRYLSQADIVLPDGTVVASVRYTPDAPLPCGAVCYVVTALDVVEGAPPAGRPPARPSGSCSRPPDPETRKPKTAAHVRQPDPPRRRNR